MFQSKRKTFRRSKSNLQCMMCFICFCYVKKQKYKIFAISLWCYSFYSGSSLDTHSKKNQTFLRHTHDWQANNLSNEAAMCSMLNQAHWDFVSTKVDDWLTRLALPYKCMNGWMTCASVVHWEISRQCFGTLCFWKIYIQGRASYQHGRLHYSWFWVTGGSRTIRA